VSNQTASGSSAAGDSVRVSIGDRQEYQFPDSQRTFELSLEPVDSAAAFEFAVGGLVRSSTDDVKTGYGASVWVDYSRFSPLVLRASIDVTWYEAQKPAVQGLDLTGFHIDLSAVFRPFHTRVRPLIGGGLSFYGNHMEDNPGLPVGDVYEEGIYYQNEARTGFGLHIRGGVDVRLTTKTRISMDLKYAFVRPEIEYVWTDQVTQVEKRDIVKLDMQTLSAFLGVSFPIR
jgi:hypothetical protein